MGEGFEAGGSGGRAVGEGCEASARWSRWDEPLETSGETSIVYTVMLSVLEQGMHS